ncbi:MAG: small multi-drug export protein [Actinomycetota bacterium]|nr:small multi-drug export protein [Actinomycetota bacterium]
MEILELVPILRNLPPAVTVALLATLPVVELRVAVPVGMLVFGLGAAETFAAAVIGNMLPIPLLVWFLDPAQRWLSEHSRLFRGFFGWLFARTRSKHGPAYERFRDLALVLFVGVPLPGTGGWTGAAAAFVFGVEKVRAFLLIFVGVVLAGVAVTLLVATGRLALSG